VELFLLSVALGAGFVVAIYSKYAPRRGWRVRPEFRQSGGSIMTIGMASMLGGAILLFATMVWWTALIASVLALALGMAVMHILKSSIQTVGFGVMAFAWLWYLLVRFGI
jgi:hypothetical protein